MVKASVERCRASFRKHSVSAKFAGSRATIRRKFTIFFGICCPESLSFLAFSQSFPPFLFPNATKCRKMVKEGKGLTCVFRNFAP